MLPLLLLHPCLRLEKEGGIKRKKIYGGEEPPELENWRVGREDTETSLSNIVWYSASAKDVDISKLFGNSDHAVIHFAMHVRKRMANI